MLFTVNIFVLIHSGNKYGGVLASGSTFFPVTPDVKGDSVPIRTFECHTIRRNCVRERGGHSVIVVKTASKENSTMLVAQQDSKQQTRPATIGQRPRTAFQLWTEGSMVQWGGL